MSLPVWPPRPSPDPRHAQSPRGARPSPLSDGRMAWAGLREGAEPAPPPGEDVGSPRPQGPCASQENGGETWPCSVSPRWPPSQRQAGSPWLGEAGARGGLQPPSRGRPQQQTRSRRSPRPGAAGRRQARAVPFCWGWRSAQGQGPGSALTPRACGPREGAPGRASSLHVPAQGALVFLTSRPASSSLPPRQPERGRLSPPFTTDRLTPGCTATSLAPTRVWPSVWTAQGRPEPRGMPGP